MLSYLTTMYQLLTWRNIILFGAISTCWFGIKGKGRAVNKRHSVELYHKSKIVWSIWCAGVNGCGEESS
jgi:hypothetical protein